MLYTIVRYRRWKRARTQSLEEKKAFIDKKQNKRKPPVGEKQTGWLAGKAGLGWTRLDRAGQGRTGCQDIYSITRLEVFRTTFIEAFVGLQVSSDAQTGTVRIILKNDLLLAPRER